MLTSKRVAIIGSASVSGAAPREAAGAVQTSIAMLTSAAVGIQVRSRG